MIIAVSVLTALILILSYVCYRMAFSVKREATFDPYRIPDSAQHRQYKEKLITMVDKTVAIPYEEVQIKSFDKYTLNGKIYITDEKAPVAILFHGYRGNCFFDFCGGLRLCLSMGQNVILVDERAHGKSEGKCLSFGILERKDVLSWAEFAGKRFGKDSEIILMGISMGAATVLMASDLRLPLQIKGIIADCGYSSPEAIISRVAKERGLPVKLVMPLVRLGAIIFGGFELKDASAVSALEKCRIPVLFIHGEEDDFVPCAMGIENYEACRSEKYLLTVPKAGHGLSYMLDPVGYVRAIKEFESRVLSRKTSEKS